MAARAWWPTCFGSTGAAAKNLWQPTSGSASQGIGALEEGVEEDRETAHGSSRDSSSDPVEATAEGPSSGDGSQKGRFVGRREFLVGLGAGTLVAATAGAGAARLFRPHPVREVRTVEIVESGPDGAPLTGPFRRLFRVDSSRRVASSPVRGRGLYGIPVDGTWDANPIGIPYPGGDRLDLSFAPRATVRAEIPGDGPLFQSELEPVMREAYSVPWATVRAHLVFDVTFAGKGASPVSCYIGWVSVDEEGRPIRVWKNGQRVRTREGEVNVVWGPDNQVPEVAWPILRVQDYALNFWWSRPVISDEVLSDGKVRLRLFVKCVADDASQPPLDVGLVADAQTPAEAQVVW